MFLENSMKLYSFQAPGSVMLLGEHAVLHGSSAVVCAINRFIRVELKPRQDDVIDIFSDRFGKFSTTIKNLTIEKPFQFVIAAILEYQDHYEKGFDLKIKSEFSDQVGLGSSAAVVVAVLGAIQSWLFGEANLEQLFNKGLKVIQKIQGVGSGADVAASVYGGIIHYQMAPNRIEKIGDNLPIALIYVGYKTPTVAVINIVSSLSKNNPKRYREIYHNIEMLVQHGIHAIRQNEITKLGKIFRQHQAYQVMLGVSDATIDMIIESCKKIPALFGEKISGSGLGDCIVTLGKLPRNTFPQNEKQKKQGIQQIDVRITKNT